MKIVLFNETDNSDVIDFGKKIKPLQTVTQLINTNESVISADKIEITAYFLDDFGREELCQQTTSFSF